MDLMTKLDIISRNTEEIITKEDLKILFETNTSPKGYIGVEPSGLFHIGWIIWVNKLKDLMNVGVKMIFLEATWHAWINDKFNGDIKKINICAEYIEHCLRALNVDTSKITFIKADSLIEDKRYWEGVLRIAKSLTLSRIKRAVTIMGRKEDETIMDFSKLIYPCMQVEDIFYLDLDICLGGMDQRRAHVLAREIAEKYHYKKPIAIHTPILPSLQGSGRMDSEEKIIEYKMSKSKPETCIFIHDSPEEIKNKINRAYCPPKEIEGNPIIEIAKKIILYNNREVVIERPKKYGGDIIINSADELISMYSKGELHPLDLKNFVSIELIKMLSNVREYFEKNENAKYLLNQLTF
ncbi:MAG: tyrosine--tRNA ligase [Candidatus Methanomethylicota archaeon]|uniref:Tyrosine--tRNA ligase n=1 Tax=Thermoproteota archaeon TaxID=2056631 RepID=A0A520KGM3_9CREN|nr:MAG: tyrosine--tRNA ligase [Candidatus Verstraetearchaeota archaeon]TDA38073.1 MAG: tyrosine--tRNA ligase [Candidatus Verstraetearchaeota archaeon]